MDSQQGRGNSFVVVTLNTFVGPPSGIVDVARFRKQAALFRKEAADVYCFQEMFSEAVVELLQSELGGEYDLHRGDRGRLALRMAQLAACMFAAMLVLLFHFLGQQLGVSPRLLAVCTLLAGCGAIWGVLRSWASVAWSFAFGPTAAGLLTMCRKETVQVQSCEYVPFEVQKGDFLNMVRQRGFLRVSAVIHSTALTVVNVHANAFPSVTLRDATPAPSADRAKQLRQAFADAASSSDGGACIVLGDFNTAEEYDEVPGQAYCMSNAWKGPEHCVTQPLSQMLLDVFPDTPRGMCNDYQYSRGLVAEGVEVIQSDLSDHLPVKVTYRSP